VEKQLFAELWELCPHENPKFLMESKSENPLYKCRACGKYLPAESGNE
jgi:tRNA(Ile2) C34 agmatinyltransferase TiaS